MFRAFICFLSLTIAAPLHADVPQPLRDSQFSSYDDYAVYVDHMVMTRQFSPLIQSLGGRNRFTSEQLAATEAQLQSRFPNDFTNRAVVKRVDLGGGFRQEMRAYWEGGRYAWYFALLHERDDTLVVLRFFLNQSATPVFAAF